jgi:hypothetical protein
MGARSLGGEPIRLSGLGRRPRVSASPGHLTAGILSPGTWLAVEVTASPDDTVAVAYADPPGEPRAVSHAALASVELRLHRRGQTNSPSPAAAAPMSTAPASTRPGSPRDRCPSADHPSPAAAGKAHKQADCGMTGWPQRGLSAARAPGVTKRLGSVQSGDRDRFGREEDMGQAGWPILAARTGVDLRVHRDVGLAAGARRPRLVGCVTTDRHRVRALLEGPPFTLLNTRRVVRSERRIERRCLTCEREKGRKRRSLVKVLDRL